MAKNLSNFFKSRQKKSSSSNNYNVDKREIGSALATGLVGLANQAGQSSASKARQAQLQMNLRLAKEKRANVQQLGQIDIADQMGLSLANRMSGATDFSGSSAEVFAQEGRNMNFSLRSQLHDMILQEVEIQNQIYAEEQKRKNAKLKTGLSAGLAVAGIALAPFTGGASLGVTAGALGSMGSSSNG